MATDNSLNPHANGAVSAYRSCPARRKDTLVERSLVRTCRGASRLRPAQRTRAKGICRMRGLPHGGWCPKGRRAEHGAILDRYTLRETPSRDYRQRTEWNVRDSDATVIFTIGAVLTGGSKLTAEFAAKHRKPWLHSAHESPGDAAALLRAFLDRHAVKVLNIAGSRASKEPDVAEFVRAVLGDVLRPGGTSTPIGRS